MPLIDIPEVGRISFPDAMSDEDITRAIEGEIIPQFAREKKEAADRKAEKDLAAHINKGGFGGAFKQAGLGALGGAQNWAGEVFGSESLKKAGAQNRAEAAALPYEATTGSDVMNVRGIAPTLNAAANVGTQFLGSMLGEYGVPIAAGVGAAALAPVAPEAAGIATAATGLARFLPAARTLIGGATTTAADIPIAGGHNIEEREVTNKQREKEGLAPLPPTDFVSHLATLGEAALLGFMPGARTVNKYIGPRMLRDAERLAPEIIAGKITQEEAVKQLASKGADYARAAAANATNVAGLGIGTAAMRIGQADENIFSPKALDEYAENAKMALVAAPLFAVPHTYGAKGKAEGKLAEAGKARETQVADEAWLAQQQAEQQAQTTNQYKKGTCTFQQ